MNNIEFLEQVAKEQIDNFEKVQIEYQDNNIIIVNTFINELYYELYNNGIEQDKIFELVTTENIISVYDSKLMYFKIKLVDFLNVNKYNLNVLCSEFKFKYAWVVHQLLDAIKEVEKNN